MRTVVQFTVASLSLNGHQWVSKIQGYNQQQVAAVRDRQEYCQAVADGCAEATHSVDESCSWK